VGHVAAREDAFTHGGNNHANLRSTTASFQHAAAAETCSLNMNLMTAGLLSDLGGLIACAVVLALLVVAHTAWV
jgi:hypothetical protein